MRVSVNRIVGNPGNELWIPNIAITVAVDASHPVIIDYVVGNPGVDNRTGPVTPAVDTVSVIIRNSAVLDSNIDRAVKLGLSIHPGS